MKVMTLYGMKRKYVMTMVNLREPLFIKIKVKKSKNDI